ncbi:RHS repeat-associated core domain-containing protein [Pseudomonas sp. P154a]|uniref:RHS repeat-associated core domain-containing protein n=1 Tax=Pseudomonas mucoides TaxID=2730424 RepID=UPI00189215A9|nr:RHS repeat-associated core domain-containing protein [Pseudomonas mucoides]MBF6041022.1 RHS repeat-associated core domain-containing protein [Pseudomonas mucoides]
MRSTVDWKTPWVKAIDGRRLTVRQMAYLRSVPGGPVETHITRQRFDTLGRPVEQRDARLANAPRPNLSTIYDLAGHPVNVDSVDAGRRTNLKGLAGETLQSWDGRGNHWRSTYDNQLRMLTLEESGHDVVDTATYASALADPNHNLRGQMIRQTDPSGTLEFSSFSLKGQPLRDSRTVTEAGTFASSRTYNPHGALLTQTDAFQHQQRMRYDIAGQLQQVHLLLEPTGTWQAVLEAARYNAAGQIIEQRAGNNVLSRWLYDEADARLTTSTAGVPGQDLLQHFEYVYDRVGNVLRIDDLTFKPVHFANQRIDGRREFTYNSLYLLTSATGHDATPGSDLPGRLLPSDPKNHLNYKQTYAYDPGGNLIKLIHERAVGGYTHQMSIDPNSNRGVPLQEGNPAPDFDSLFDRHGNLQASGPGRPLYWNNRNQLASATLVHRDNDLNDEETYRYSQGARVFKRHETHTSSTTHFHQVIYLPGLEIRTRDNGEELHVIAVPGGRSSVRCLHWVSKKPDGIDQDQLRYSLDDHLGSSLMELDQTARLVSYEGYYPFGGTAWLMADSALEVSYKTLRYSGKEMDVSGFYYYGVRYYAPWLQRWINPDPLGTVDGLNLYQMVGNNPINFVDNQGGVRTASQQVSIPMTPLSSSPTQSIAGSTTTLSGLTPLVNDPANNPPGQMPPEPEESWSEKGKRFALAAVNSRVGLALLPVGTSSPANAAIVATIFTAATQFILQATVFNPGWSPPGTWDPTGDGSLPSKDVTQEANRQFGLISTGMTVAGATVGAVLGPVVGGYVDELRGAKEKAEKKAKAGEMSSTIKRLIAEQSLLDEVTPKAQTSLRDQVLEVESLTGITWNTMEMLEKITQLRPSNLSESIDSSRRSSISSQSSAGVIHRGATSRKPVHPVKHTRRM